MYRPYFGLNQLPFKTTPELDMFYREGSREEILQALEYTVVRGDGILKVVGEVGCGKTMILRLLANELDDSFKLIYVNSPNLTAKDMLLFICTELGVNVLDSQQKFTLIHLLQNRLLELHSQGKKVVMLIDEAQAMTMDGLEEIRLLSNLETDSDKLLQVVLFGQPELDRALEHPNIRQLKSRITYNIYIPPLSVADVLSYLNFRMRKSGYSGIDVFTLSAAKKIHKLTGGYPRDINVIADKLLMSVFSYQDKFVKSKHFNAIEQGSNSYSWFKVASLIGLVSTLLVLYWFYSDLQMKNLPSLSGSTSFSVEASVAKDDISEDTSLVTTYTNKQSREQFATPSESGAVVRPEKAVENLNKLEFENNGVVVSQPAQKKDLLGSIVEPFFDESREVVQALSKDGYSIQLATITMESYPKMQQEFENIGVNIDDVFYVVDLKGNVENGDGGFLRLKVYFGKEKSYSLAKQALQNLPEKMQRSKPFIVSFYTIKKQFNQALQFVNNTSGGSYVSEP